MAERSERSRRFTEHLQKCQAQVLRYIFALVRNTEDAQDIFQQTCVVLWDKFDQFDSGRSFSAWACGVARFEVRKFLTKHRRQLALFSDEFAQRLAEIQVDSVAGEIEVRRAALRECVDKLPPRQQELLALRYGENRRVAEIAVSIGRPVCGVHNSLRIIRGKLMQCIEHATKEGGK